MRPEEVLLPVRLALQTFHFLAMLTVLWDVDHIVSVADGFVPGTTNPAAVARYNSNVNLMTAISYASVACFAIEYVLMFGGVTMFNRGIYIFNIIAHFSGTILMVLFYYYVWDLSAYYAMFALLSAVPAAWELLTFLLGAWMRSFKI